jgi:hypothetical protein
VPLISNGTPPLVRTQGVAVANPVNRYLSSGGRLAFTGRRGRRGRQRSLIFKSVSAKAATLLAAELVSAISDSRLIGYAA